VRRVEFARATQPGARAARRARGRRESWRQTRPAGDARRFGSRPGGTGPGLGRRHRPGVGDHCLGGDPGIGKSTLTPAGRGLAWPPSRPVIYASLARRFGGWPRSDLPCAASRRSAPRPWEWWPDTDLPSILALAAEQRAALLVIDFHSDGCSRAARGRARGAVSQLRRVHRRAGALRQSSGTAVINCRPRDQGGARSQAAPARAYWWTHVLYFEMRRPADRYRIVRCHQ